MCEFGKARWGGGGGSYVVWEGGFGFWADGLGLLGGGWVGSWWVVLGFGGAGAGLGVVDAFAVCDCWGYMGA